MPITLKTTEQIEVMRRAGRLAVAIIEKMKSAARPGISSREIDDLVRDELSRAGAIAPVKGHRGYRQPGGFPGHCCICINEEVLHSAPDSRRLKEGDIVTLDLGLMLDGFCASRAVTVAVGSVTPEARRLLQVTDEVLAAAVSRMGSGVRWSEVARLIQSTVEGNGYNVVREFVGHGIGQRLIEDPMVPNFTSRQPVGQALVLRTGMTLTVEPVVLSGSREIILGEDGSTVITRDGKLGAHARHTVAITAQGMDVLTGDC